MKVLDRKLPVPLYYQLFTILEERILSSHLKPSDYFSTEMELQEQFAVSRATIRKALEQLENNHYISRITGKGIFITSAKLKVDLPDLLSFSEEMKKRGMVPGTKLLGVKLIDPPMNVRDALQLTADERTLLIRRIRYGDDIPIVYCESYIPEKVGMTVHGCYTGSLYELIHKHTGFPIEKATHGIEACLAEEEIANYLSIEKGYPMLTFRRTAYNLEGDAVVYESGAARADQYSYEITLKRTVK